MDGDSHWANRAALILASLALLVALSGRIGWEHGGPAGLPPVAQAQLRANLERLGKGMGPQFRVPGKQGLPMMPPALSPKLLPAPPLLPDGPSTLVIPPG